MQELFQLTVNNQRILVREDWNAPLDDKQKITSTARIDASLATLRYLLERNAAVTVMSHLGRPKADVPAAAQKAFSLRPVVEYLRRVLNYEVAFVEDWEHIPAPRHGVCTVLENVRFLPGECDNNPELAQKMATLCDLFVMDAFAAAHRAHASTCGVIQYARQACAGPLLMQETNALKRALEAPQRPLLVIVGGAKVSTKLEVLQGLAQVADQIIVGGGIANTFLAAQGYPVGTSLAEPALINEAQTLCTRVTVPLPEDVVVAKRFSPDAPVQTVTTRQIVDDDMILDVGPRTINRYLQLIEQAETIIWNGPLGVFEFPSCAQGTRELAQMIARSSAFSLAGGGDTIAAIERFGVRNGIGYISTAGGAFLEFLAGRTLPTINALAGNNQDASK